MKYNIGDIEYFNGIECKVVAISNGFVYFNGVNSGEFVCSLFNEENK